MHFVEDVVCKPRSYRAIMLSSTFTDLKEHRQRAIESISRNHYLPKVMEHSGAQAEADVIETSLSMVREAVAYVGVISHKYGQTPFDQERNPNRLSITELEFNEAMRLDRPILLFIMGDDHPVKKADIESDPERIRSLDAFRERAKQMRRGNEVQRVYEVFDSLEQFSTAVATAIGNLVRYLERLLSGRSAESGDRPRLAIANIPINIPFHFIGREATIDEIEQTFSRNDGRRAVVALHGLRGVGKTTLAAAYAESRRDNCRATWWIRAESESTARADLVGLGVQLGWVAADAQEEQAVDAILRRLRAEGEGILLVYDNAIGPKELAKVLPRGGGPQIIITSNSPNWRGDAIPIEVDVWPKEVGADFLVARAGRAAERAAALGLSDVLGGLPLAHEQAAAYCGRLGISLTEYAERFAAAPGVVLDDAAPEQYHNGLTVSKTFALAIDEANRLHPAAELLIVSLSLLAAEPIPLLIFSEASKLGDGALEPIATPDAFDGAIASLRAFGLIDHEVISDERQPEIGTNTVGLHRLVRRIAASRFDGATRERIRGELVAAILDVYPKDVLNQPKAWPRARRLDSHAISLVGSSSSLPPGFEIESAALLSLLLAYRHASLSTFLETQALAERALKVRQERLGEDHSDSIASLNDLAWVLRDTGDLARSEALARHAVELSERKHGPWHLETAGSLHTLALTLHEAGKLEDARLLFERDLEISKREFGEQHKETAVSFKSLAQLLHDQEDLPAARENYERAMEIFEKVSGPEHPDVATSACDLASVLRDQGDFDEALPLYERAAQIAEKMLGDVHPVVGTILHNVGRLNQAQKKFEEALSLYGRSLEIFDQSLGAHHPETQNLVDDLGALLHDLERFDEALPFYRRALKEVELRWGTDSQEAAEALNDLGRLFDDQGKLDDAVLHYRRALKIAEQKLGAEHKQTGAILDNLARVLHDQDKFHEALPLYLRALHISETERGAEDEETGTALNNLGHLFVDLGKFSKALPLFRRALNISIKTSGPNDLETSIVLDNIGAALFAQGKYAQALEPFQQSLDIRTAALGNEHPHTKDAAEELAEALWALKKYGKAKTLRRKFALSS